MPAHCARATVKYLHQTTPEFISHDLWLPNSPDHKPVNYKIWGCVQECVYQKPIRDMDQLKQRLVEMCSDVHDAPAHYPVGIVTIPTINMQCQELNVSTLQNI